jgi:hypothetical protein
MEFCNAGKEKKDILTNTGKKGARGIVVGWGTKLQAVRLQDGIPMRLGFFFSIFLILPAALWPWDRLNLLQKWIPGISLGGKRRPARKVDNLTAICEHIV